MVPLFVFTFSSFVSSSSMFDEAKRWFEASTVICRFVPGGKECAEKVRQIRLHVLSMVSIGVYLEPLTNGTLADPSKDFRNLYPSSFTLWARTLNFRRT